MCIMPSFLQNTGEHSFPLSFVENISQLIFRVYVVVTHLFITKSLKSGYQLLSAWSFHGALGSWQYILSLVVIG